MDNNHLSPPPPDSAPSSSAAAATTINDSNSRNNINSRDQFLRHLTHLNKLSHKISKPSSIRPSEPPLPVHSSSQPHQQQPPVYNISKSDFRDVVQKLTGSPAHPPPSSSASAAAAAAAPPPIHASKPNSSRLQRIRPPPLAQLGSLPPPMLRPPGSGFGPGMAPLSPLPPLPSCHGAADSPISSYMRFLHSAVNHNMMFPPPENMENVPPQSSSVSEASLLMPPPPSSPLPFGCLPSPKSPCQPRPPTLLLPLSPTVSGAPSPK